MFIADLSINGIKGAKNWGKRCFCGLWLHGKSLKKICIYKQDISIYESLCLFSCRSCLEPLKLLHKFCRSCMTSQKYQQPISNLSELNKTQGSTTALLSRQSELSWTPALQTGDSITICINRDVSHSHSKDRFCDRFSSTLLIVRVKYQRATYPLLIQ